MHERRLIVEAVSVEAVGAGEAAVRNARTRLGAAGPAPVAATVRMFSDGRWHDAALVERAAARPGQTIAGPAIVVESNATTVVEPGWAARVTALDHLVLERTRRAAGAARRRHPGRSGAARGVQQPVHEHRRADGAAAAEHRLLGQHQGAARLLVRAVRRRRQPDRQRAAHAGAPRLDERVDQDRDRAERRPHAARRRLRAQRSVPRRHAPARRDGRDAGVPRRRRASRRPSTSARAATTPTSAGSRRARCRRSRPASRRRACRSTTSSWSRAAASSRPRRRALLESGPWPSRNPAQNIADLKAQIAANEKGARELRGDGRAVRPRRRSRATCSTCRTTPRSRCAASSRG